MFHQAVDFHSKRTVLVVGYGISGKSVYNFMVKLGHRVFAVDDNDTAGAPDKLHEIIWDDIDVVVKSPSVPIMQHNMHHAIRKAIECEVPVISTFDVFKLHNPDTKLIAVTGTNGKSTTASLIFHILSDAGFSVRLGGNIGIPYFDMDESEFCVLEMSSYELASSRFLDFYIACVLNIEPDHCEFHGSFENYMDSKHAALESSMFKVISCDDEHTVGKFSTVPNVVTVSLSDCCGSDIYIREDALHDRELQRVVIDLTGMTNLLGKHNHQNIEFAYAICKKIGVPTQEIAKSVHSFKPLPHRINVVRQISNIIFVNDSKATNPMSAANALATFVGYEIYWLVGGRSKHVDPLQYISDYLIGVQKIYLFGESVCEFEEVFTGLKPVVKCSTMSEALNIAYKDARRRLCPVVVLLSPMCASFDQFKSYEHRGDEFVKMVSNLKE
jgi:UDP-N-acetylmuramoylalanine--D-glutamate ligase